LHLNNSILSEQNSLKFLLLRCIYTNTPNLGLLSSSLCNREVIEEKQNYRDYFSVLLNSVGSIQARA
jgi:hypothetical protein